MYPSPSLAERVPPALKKCASREASKQDAEAFSEVVMGTKGDTGRDRQAGGNQEAGGSEPVITQVIGRQSEGTGPTESEDWAGHPGHFRGGRWGGSEQG